MAEQTQNIADLIQTALDEEWFNDEDANRKMGAGSGIEGRIKMQEAFLMQVRNPHLVQVEPILKGGHPVGFFSLARIEDHRLSIHMFMAPHARGIGVAPKAAEQLLDEVFKNGIYRVEADVPRINKKAIRFIRHFGFKQEGIKRQGIWIDGHPHDLVMLAMLRAQWRRRQATSPKERRAVWLGKKSTSEA